MISFQASPVVMRKRVRMAWPKFWKLAYSLSCDYSLTLANRYTPSSAYTTKNNSNNDPTFTKSVNAAINVLKILYSDLNLFTIFNTLSILKDLKTVENGPTLI